MSRDTQPAARHGASFEALASREHLRTRSVDGAEAQNSLGLVRQQWLDHTPPFNGRILDDSSFEQNFRECLSAVA